MSDDGKIGTEGRNARALRILFLGGTGFIGPHQVRYALARGHQVTLFNRGRTSPEMFPEAEKLRGDRASDLTALEGRSWDVVIDNSATNPEWVERSTTVLAGNVDRYVFVSSTGVFFPYEKIGLNEDDPPLLEDDPPQEQLSYGVAKARSENVVRDAFPDGALIVRPHYIIGPGDPMDRLTSWILRVRRGGALVAPGSRSAPVQFIDVRDLTEWMIRSCEEARTGTFICSGPEAELPMAGMVYGIHAVLGGEVTWNWIPDLDFLEEHGMAFAVPWVPPVGPYVGMNRIDTSRAVAAGLTYRPLADTVRATLEWWDSQPAERTAEVRQGPTPETEAAIIAAWNARAEPGAESDGTNEPGEGRAE